MVLSGRGEEGALRTEQAVSAAAPTGRSCGRRFFAQNFSEGFVADAVNAGVVALPAGQVVEPFIDIEDIADIATWR